jgi:primary-amine oxidase
MWDNDGDDVWTPPTACLSGKSSDEYIVYSEATTDVGNKRGYKVEIPSSHPQLLPEHDPFLHLQNFTKCDIAVTAYNPADKHAVSQSVFGNLYPIPAEPGHDISHFMDGESLEQTDLVLYIHQTKHHFVIGEDVPVPTTMGKEISLEPYNYFTDGVGPFKHLPKSMYRYAQGPEGVASAVRPATAPVEQCTITTV